MGPGAWQGAKKAIEDARANVVYSTKTRSLPKKEDAGKSNKRVLVLILILLFVLSICMRRFSVLRVWPFFARFFGFCAENFKGWNGF